MYITTLRDLTHGVGGSIWGERGSEVIFSDIIHDSV